MILIIIFLVLFLIFIFRCNQIQTQTPTQIQTQIPILSTDPIITYYKSGGIVGYVIRLEIYQNNTFKIFSHGKLIKTGNLDSKLNMAVSKILRDYSVLEKIPKTTVDGYDFLYYSIDVNGKHFSLNVDSFGPEKDNYEQLINNNKVLFDSIDQLKHLIDDVGNL